MADTEQVRIVRTLIGCALVLGALQPLPANAGGSTYYLDPNGSDDASGSETAPWRTFWYGIKTLRPGDTLIVRGGNYRGTAGWRPADAPRATATRPIRVIAAAGERPVLRGVLAMDRPSYWTFDGINITRDPNAKRTTFLLRIRNGVGWTFRNGEIWGNTRISNVTINGTVKGEPRDWRFSGNCVHDIGAGPNANNDHNMYLMPGYSSGPGVVERNVFFGVPNGNHIKAAGPNGSTGAANVKIRYNTMWRGSQGILLMHGSHHVSMQRNIIAGRWNGRADNPGIRGHELRNSTNIAANNLVAGYRSVLLNTQASRGKVRNGGGNVRKSPSFDRTGVCDGFLPQATHAKAYGHLAA